MRVQLRHFLLRSPPIDFLVHVVAGERGCCRQRRDGSSRMRQQQQQLQRVRRPSLPPSSSSLALAVGLRHAAPASTCMRPCVLLVSWCECTEAGVGWLALDGGGSGDDGASRLEGAGPTESEREAQAGGASRGQSLAGEEEEEEEEDADDGWCSDDDADCRMARRGWVTRLRLSLSLCFGRAFRWV